MLFVYSVFVLFSVSSFACYVPSVCVLQAIAAEAAAVAAENEARRLGGPPPSLRKQLATYLVTRSGKCTAVLVKERDREKRVVVNINHGIRSLWRG